MSRRPSLPGAAELFRATGSSPTADRPATRDLERNGQRLRAADPAPAEPVPVPERTASVTPLAPNGAAAAMAEPAPPLGMPAAPRAAESAASLAPAVRPAPADPIGRTPAAYGEGTPARRAPANGVRQTRRQRMRTVGERRPSGRERHEEKITVYCSAEELLDLETARLTLRGEHGLVVDRGRIVREAVAIILADLDAKADESILVRRLREL
jgi:hypothetical protein